MNKERFVTQTTFYSPEDPGSGNCTEASIAFLLGIRLAEVPVLYDPTSENPNYRFWRNFEAFLGDKGYHVLRLPGNHVPDCLYLASGPASRGCRHMVVYREGELIWDPHPSREGLLSVEDVHVLIPRDPAEFRRTESE